MKDWLRVFYWRWVKNAKYTFQYIRSTGHLNYSERALLDALRSNGIVKSDTLADSALLAEVLAEAQRLFDDNWDSELQRPRVGASDYKGKREKMDPMENKDFLVVLTSKSFSASSPFLRYALQPAFRHLANAYLGQNTRLRAVHLWLNYATDMDASSTQLWHRDGDDIMNLKFFTYLSDVNVDNGPFTYIPGTQPLGYRQINPPQSKYQRTNDDEMANVVQKSEWAICTGKTGDVILSDTVGYHKGMKPRKGYRLMLVAQYASRAAVSGSDIALNDSPEGWLSDEQLAALR